MLRCGTVSPLLPTRDLLQLKDLSEIQFQDLKSIV